MIRHQLNPLLRLLHRVVIGLLSLGLPRLPGPLHVLLHPLVLHRLRLLGVVPGPQRACRDHRRRLAAGHDHGLRVCRVGVLGQLLAQRVQLRPVLLQRLLRRLHRLLTLRQLRLQPVQAMLRRVRQRVLPLAQLRKQLRLPPQHRQRQQRQERRDHAQLDCERPQPVRPRALDQQHQQHQPQEQHGRVRQTRRQRRRLLHQWHVLGHCLLQRRLLALAPRRLGRLLLLCQLLGEELLQQRSDGRRLGVVRRAAEADDGALVHRLVFDLGA
ncbi:unnamed protein product [Chondrus crispus]|uniref:Uncharacterized protein n=1 Tax=Chondrus crispus TaxID=2769 RepID=R7QMR4_CHOCR|nr:unnamed protein product [Chondrus crispus]CDF38776.1 unnamed protein product [Chondrus crispus]|eukprot:XP_005718681.1 unnamed protein product [Chondrus crispus]